MGVLKFLQDKLVTCRTIIENNRIILIFNNPFLCQHQFLEPQQLILMPSLGPLEIRNSSTCVLVLVR